ncbi:hypothetical protein WN944_015549 [Citrus x changshan-huyou]|uniref:Uncharacterized protein n=1 Tax=Citrus x changshan-huyou TaxID=2935761 RepID=A0AAP0MA10_9ROSI
MCHLNFLQKWPLIIHELTSKLQIIREAATDEGALDAFVLIVTGPSGLNPVQLMPSISIPVLVLWGDEDPFTPVDGPVGKAASLIGWLKHLIAEEFTFLSTSFDKHYIMNPVKHLFEGLFC